MECLLSVWILLNNVQVGHGNLLQPFEASQKSAVRAGMKIKGTGSKKYVVKEVIWCR